MRAIVIGGSGQIGGWLLRAPGRPRARRHRHLRYGRIPGPPSASTPPTARRRRPGSATSGPTSSSTRPASPGSTAASSDPQKARASNLEEPLNLARVAADLGARFVYFSTDYVFRGDAGPDAEDDPADPPNAYGRAKLDAERAIADALGDRALIARTSWVYGPERQGKNFAYQVVRRLVTGQPVMVPSDQRSSPSYAPDVALAAIRLAEDGRSGLYHVAGPEVVSRPDFAKAIAEAFGLDPSPIGSKPTAEFGAGAAPRPLQGGLKTARLEGVLPGLVRPLAPALADFRRRLDAGEGWSDPRQAPAS